MKLNVATHNPRHTPLLFSDELGQDQKPQGNPALKPPFGAGFVIFPPAEKEKPTLAIKAKAAISLAAVLLPKQAVKRRQQRAIKAKANDLLAAAITASQNHRTTDKDRAAAWRVLADYGISHQITPEVVFDETLMAQASCTGRHPLRLLLDGEDAQSLVCVLEVLLSHCFRYQKTNQDFPLLMVAEYGKAAYHSSGGDIFASGIIGSIDPQKRFNGWCVMSPLRKRKQSEFYLERNINLVHWWAGPMVDHMWRGQGRGAGEAFRFSGHREHQKVTQGEVVFENVEPTRIVAKTYTGSLEFVVCGRDRGTIRYLEGEMANAFGDLCSGSWPQKRGRIQCHDGITYEGSFRCATLAAFPVPHGEGMARRGQGVYQGHFEHGMRCGGGVQRYPDQSLYKGQWRDNQRCDDNATWVTTDHCMLTGPFVKDLPDGLFKRTFSDGRQDCVLYIAGDKVFDGASLANQTYLSLPPAKPGEMPQQNKSEQDT